MKNKDLLVQEKAQILQRMNDAINSQDADAFAKCFEELSLNIQEHVINEAGIVQQQRDVSVLASRGVRQLTSEESKYYEKVIEAMRSSGPKQALSELDVVLPKTTIDAVFEDLTTDHPLLEAVDFQNTSAMVEVLLNTNGEELASWGTLTSEIVKELTSGFKKINMSLEKLSAFLPVSKSMLDLGPIWMDRYVRMILSEALANGLENGIVCGTGKDMPIGMNRQVGEGVTVTGGVYPEKKLEKITKFDPVTYGKLIAELTKGPNGKTRKINNLILLINPADYFGKIMPATTIRTPDGKYVNDVLPYPTTIIQTTQVTAGKAIFGLGKRYFMGIGTEKSGKIEYSDEYKFLEDERVYLVKLYGHGEPKDNNAFTYLDISALEPLIQEVKVIGTVETQAKA